MRMSNAIRDMHRHRIIGSLAYDPSEWNQLTQNHEITKDPKFWDCICSRCGKKFSIQSQSWQLRHLEMVHDMSWGDACAETWPR